MDDPPKRNLGRGALLLERIKKAQQEKENSNVAPARIPGGFPIRSEQPKREKKQELQTKLRGKSFTLPFVIL